MVDSFYMLQSQTIVIAVLAVFVVVVAIFYGAPWLVRWRQVRRWKRGSGGLALTYDDGPDNVTTVALLDLLDELDVPATFYLVGFRAETCPTVLARLCGSRHELGTHSHFHKHAWKRWPWSEYRDAMRAYQTLNGTVHWSSAFRPPFGKISLPTLIGMWARGRRVEWWTVAAQDHLDVFEDPEVIAERIVADGQGVVLMHCHHAEAHRRDFMLSLTRALVSKARSRGIRLTTMSDLTQATA